MPANTAKGTANRGTRATGPAMMAITATNIKAKGKSARMNRLEEVRKLRTDSKCRICEAKVPTVLGLASIRMSSALPKNTADSSWSIALQALSVIKARTCLSTSSITMAMTTPMVNTHKVE